MLAGLWHEAASLARDAGLQAVESAAMLRDLLDLIHRPVSALRAIDTKRRLPDGLLALGLSVILPAIASELAALGPFRPPANLGSLPSLTAQGADLYARWTYEHRFLLPLYGILASVAIWLLAALLIHLIARALGGRAEFAGYLKLVGFIALVGLLALPIALLDALIKLQGNAPLELTVGQLAGLVSLAIFIYQNILLVLAARLHYQFSTERAVAAVVGPIGIVVVLALALVVVAIVLLVLTQQVPL